MHEHRELRWQLLRVRYSGAAGYSSDGLDPGRHQGAAFAEAEVKLGPQGRALIMSFEKCRLLAYKDGGGVWTIGWGHTGPEVVEGLEWSQKQADAALDADCAEAEEIVGNSISVPLTQPQFDALVSFEYNTGGLPGSTLRRYLNTGDYLGAAREFPRWNFDNGQQVRGLTRRRLAEQALFTSF